MNEVAKLMRGYRVGQPIGRGTRSVVYEVWRKGDSRKLAAKFVAVRDEADLNVVRHLENEYRVLRQVHESGNGQPIKGIVRAIEMRKVRRLFKLCAAYLVLELVEGKCLADVRDYPMHDMLNIFEQVCSALQHVHHNDFVHADLKPENIVVGPSLRVKLVDFGFAAPVGSKLRGVKGTWGFLAPEQAGGELTAQTDVFNLGAVMYWAFTGEKLPEILPEGGNRASFLPTHDLPIMPPRQLNPELPKDLSDLILQCCEPEPSDRPVIERVKTAVHNMSLRCQLGM